jgi:hypothetical protein
VRTVNRPATNAGCIVLGGTAELTAIVYSEPANEVTLPPADPARVIASPPAEVTIVTAVPPTAEEGLVKRKKFVEECTYK